MLIYDRRRCRPPQVQETRARLTIPQRARLGQLEGEGWRLLFVRGEPAVAYVTHDQKGHAMVPREGRVIAVRSLPVRGPDATEGQADGTADAADGFTGDTPHAASA